MKYHGIITPMITPFSPDGEINYSATETLLEYLRTIGVTGVFPLSSTGVFPWLSVSEKKTFLKYVYEHAKNLSVIAGIGSANTRESVLMAKYAKNLGIKTVVLMPPYYIHPGQEELLKHYSTVLAVDIDMFVYNIPQLSGVNIPVESVKYLKEEYSNVVGIKDSSANMRYFIQLMHLKDSHFSVFQGQDDLLYVSLALGADGGVCGTSNFAEYIVKLQNYFDTGAVNKALNIHNNIITPLMRSLNSVTFPAGYYFAFYTTHNIIEGYRVPMHSPNASQKNAIISILNQSKQFLQ